MLQISREGLVNWCCCGGRGRGSGRCCQCAVQLLDEQQDLDTYTN